MNRCGYGCASDRSILGLTSSDESNLLRDALGWRGSCFRRRCCILRAAGRDACPLLPLVGCWACSVGRGNEQTLEWLLPYAARHQLRPASNGPAPGRQPLPPAATPCKAHNRAANAGIVMCVARRPAQAPLPVTRALQLDAAMASEARREFRRPLWIRDIRAKIAMR